MSRSYVSQALRAAVAAAARYRCGYCLTLEQLIGASMTIEHIVPEAAGGLTVEDNLWLACTMCNSHKGNRTVARDEVTGHVVRLFNPRRQAWAEHFLWQHGGTVVAGLTPVGRATVATLRLNRTLLVKSRRLWVAYGLHPPAD